MLEALKTIDTQLFLLLNGLHTDGLDPVMVWISGRATWWPFYLFLLGFLVWKKKLQTVLVVLLVALGLIVTDQLSVHLFKDVFERLRPCKEPGLADQVHLVNGHCGGMYGFVSSHAANVFGVATFLSLVIQKKWFNSILITWALLVGYSRIYLGVHYPGDVIGGALLGILAGSLMFILFRYLKQFFPEKWNKDQPK